MLRLSIVCPPENRLELSAVGWTSISEGLKPTPVSGRVTSGSSGSLLTKLSVPDETPVSDGEKAIQYLRNLDQKPGFMLLDLNLPKKGGLEILKELRIDPDPLLNLLPVIILTNSKTSQDVQRAYKHRCNAFVRKPIGYERLVDMARKLSQFWCRCAILPNRASSPPPSSS